MMRPLSVWRVTLVGVEVTAERVARVPAENLRVSRSEFGALWTLAEQLGSQPARGDHYLVGVIYTCRWLAAQSVWSPVLHRWQMPAAPLTRRRHRAMPETIEQEYLAAATAPAFTHDRARGVMVTIEWSWHGSHRPPLDLSTATPAAG
jgi:hypothetical protein